MRDGMYLPDTFVSDRNYIYSNETIHPLSSRRSSEERQVPCALPLGKVTRTPPLAVLLYREKENAPSVSHRTLRTFISSSHTTMWLFFDTPDHPLIAHIRTLIDAYGVDAEWRIRGTTYKFYWPIHIESDEFYGRYGYLTDTASPENIINIDSSDHRDKFTWWKKLFLRADFLMKKAQAQLEEDAIQERINADIEKYLSKDSPLPEAKEDLKQMEFHKKEIIRIATKWQDKFTSLHL